VSDAVHDNNTPIKQIPVLIHQTPNFAGGVQKLGVAFIVNPLGLQY